MNINFQKKPNTCEIWGTSVHVLDKWEHTRKNLRIEITEYHKSGRCTVDRKFLANHKPSIDEAMNTIVSFTKLDEEISINCENIAANQIKILGFNMEIAKPCINELILLCSSSIDKL